MNPAKIVFNAHVGWVGFFIPFLNISKHFKISIIILYYFVCKEIESLPQTIFF